MPVTPTMHGSGATKSIWMESPPKTRMLTSLAQIRPDVIIVGGGMAGLSTAYQLSLQHLRPLIIDDGGLADGETARTTAHLTNAIDDRIYEIERLFGRDGSRKAVRSHGEAIDTIEQNVRRERIECDFRRLEGYLFLQEPDDPKNLDKELDAAHRAGFRGVKRLARAPIDGFDTGTALRFPKQGQFHPLRYMQGLARAIERRTGPFLYRGRVSDVKGGADVRVRLEGGEELTADHAVLATNAPTISRLSIHTKQAPYRTFVIGARVPKGSVEPALFWDTLQPYHYVRTQPLPDSDDELLIVGGEDARTGQSHDTSERWRRLEIWARARFPMMQDIEYHWSGQVIETIDGLAYLGRQPMQKNVYVITGDSGMGMTHTTIGSLLVTDLILQRDNPYTDLYDPSRKNVRAPLTWAMELLGQSRGYLRHFTPRSVNKPEEIPAGEGAVIRHGLRQVAYYRDEKGVLNAFSAMCTHLGCIVSWAAAEKSWECPCHGSRFDPMGKVLNGPAPSELKRLETRAIQAEARKQARPPRGRATRAPNRSDEPKKAAYGSRSRRFTQRHEEKAPHRPRKRRKVRRASDNP